MDFTDSCKSLLEKVTGKIAFAEAKKLYDRGELEKAKKKLLSISSWELSNNAEASYLLANVYLKLINNYTRSDDIKKIHKQIIKHLSDAMGLQHKEAKYLYYQHYDGYGNLKSQTSENTSSRYILEDAVSIQSKEIFNMLNIKLCAYVKEYNNYQHRNELHVGAEITNAILDNVHTVFPSIKKEDILFYKGGARHNWTMFCANHYYDSSGEHGSISDIVRVERIDYSKPLLLFYEDGKTSLARFPKEKKDFTKLVNVVKDFEQYLITQGNEFFGKKIYDKAYPFLLECATVYNNTDAQSKMAILYKNGYHVKKDATKAAYYQELANKKNIKNVVTKETKKLNILQIMIKNHYIKLYIMGTIMINMKINYKISYGQV